MDKMEQAKYGVIFGFMAGVLIFSQFVFFVGIMAGLIFGVIVYFRDEIISSLKTYRKEKKRKRSK